MTRSCICFRGMSQFITIGSATRSFIRILGFNELHVSWNTACTELRYPFNMPALAFWTS